ncbi:helix-turn-helix domain-containing protein [Actinokineospora spheciospongiae]|uniref:helix-turn-helix domain-containing protein n=1 Tax=Actinokineospora spheciospongiae TaxID=909613 RepID=UPI000D70F823|nr:helix-turn-helix domain-containing protein [Actinokineospora spheciospongiae]PWW54282.1 helix-turn-helix protein [Actinokineospora spheciospongiae]
MWKSPTTLTSSQGSRSTGVISGFVFQLARRTAGLTQERLAESLGVDVTTLQSWESGRRPLAAMPAGDFFRLGDRLIHLGAPPSTRRHLREALEADLVLATGITAADAWIEPDMHPLATQVHRRSLTNLITWPLTGKPPPHFTEFIPKVPRRGPGARQPHLSAEEIRRLFDHLITVAEQGRRPEDALLRRQAVYLLSFDDRPHIVDWLREEWQRAGRKLSPDGDITTLMEARSASVALASTGDESSLHDFLTVTANTTAETANLNYWAHWIGESPREQNSDDFMRDIDTHLWSGARLLHHLTERLVPTSLHLPLNLHTIHALVASRPTLLTDAATIRQPLAEALDRVASAGPLTRMGHSQVTGLHYALRIAER